MPARNPAQLVDEFKKSGEFDRLRRELLNTFRSGSGMATLVARVEEIASNKLASESKLQHMAEALAVRELMQELERYPLIERAVADVPALTSATFSSSLRQHITSLLHDQGDIQQLNRDSGVVTAEQNEQFNRRSGDDAPSKDAIRGPALVLNAVRTEHTLVDAWCIDPVPKSPGSEMLESPPSEAEANLPRPHPMSLSS